MVLRPAWTARAGALPRGAAVLLLAGSLLAASWSSAGEAPDASPPDSAHLAKLTALFGDGAVARVRSADGTTLLRHAQVSADGIAGDLALGRPGALTSFEHEHRLVAWREIERLERLDSWSAPGWKLGAVAGLAAGLVVAANIHERWGARSMVGLEYGYPGPSDGAPVVERMIVIVGMPIVGAMTGGFVGSAIPRWRTVAP